jgi:hypothetical protein
VYDINGCTFYIKAKDSRSQCQNSGVRVDAADSTGKNAYYGRQLLFIMSSYFPLSKLSNTLSDKIIFTPFIMSSYFS